MKYCILGKHGFIGSALTNHLEAFNHTVTSNPTKDCDAIINLASPTHLEFDRNISYNMSESVQSALNLLPFCKENNIYYIYASSALVYENEKESAFKNCKIILEQLAEAYGGRTLGLRIFPVYGPKEDRSFIAQACAKMKKGEAPVLYGDGSQERDFIYIDDVVDGITSLMRAQKTGIRDIGAGKPVKFSTIISTINEILNTDIQPKYAAAPSGYSKGISCWNPITTNFSIYDGIRTILLGR